MVFSSLTFLFIFLPSVIFLYYTVFRKSIVAQNGLLLISSLLFYAWGEPRFAIVMIFSIFVNYVCGLLISKYADKKKLFLIIDIIFNLALLYVFKYLNFTIYNINQLFGNVVPQTSIVLPIGISFFTFQAMSYVIDVYRGDVKVQNNPFYVALYISFFPQLIAGPIVRYTDIEERINERHVTSDTLSEGIRLFIIGLSKKVLIANNLALITDGAFSGSEGGLCPQQPSHGWAQYVMLCRYILTSTATRKWRLAWERCSASISRGILFIPIGRQPYQSFGDITIYHYQPGFEIMSISLWADPVLIKEDGC